MNNNLGYKIRRLIGYGIDWYLYSLILIAFNIIFAKVSHVEATTFATLELYTKKQAIICIMWMIALHIIYYVIIPYCWKGQTIGKKIVKLQVVSIEDKPATLTQLLLREVIGVFLVEGYLSPLNAYFRTLLGMNFGDVSLLAKIWFGISGLSAASCLYSPSSRMIHDYIAKTKVMTIK